MDTFSTSRSGDRRQAAFQARLTWRDASGAMRFASVVTRDFGETDVFVECQMPTSISLYRLVYLQLERGQPESPEVPPALRKHERVLAAVYRVGPRRASTGTPVGYALRLLVEPTLTHTVEAEPAAYAVSNW
jgi:hypothetical protein